jgi:hypothetical protein
VVGVDLNSRAERELLRAPAGERTANVQHIAASPDGKTLAVALGDCSQRLGERLVFLDMDTGAEVRSSSARTLVLRVCPGTSGSCTGATMQPAWLSRRAQAPAAQGP